MGTAGYLLLVIAAGQTDGVPATAGSPIPPAVTGGDIAGQGGNSLLDTLIPSDETPEGVEGLYDPFGPQFAYGNAGFTPYRTGWFSYDDFVFVPSSPARGTAGSLQVTEWNSWMRYARPVGNDVVVAWTGAFNSKFWQGPSGVPLPGDGDQLVSDFQVLFPERGRWGAQFGITPQVNSDFRRGLTRGALFLDGRAAVTYRPNDEFQWVFGAAYWQRARTLVVPYGGLVWTPDSRWECRLLFPKSRVSRYLGKTRGTDFWAYASAEYDVEAYQISLEDAAQTKERVEFSDWRALLGVNAQRGRMSLFAEAGWVFDRHVRFGGPTRGFGLSDAAIVRTGLLW